jgi:hypothetical protein
MWIFAKNGFLSIVQHSEHKPLVLVRSRFRGDIEELFPGVEDGVEETPDADYRFRALLPRHTVAETVGKLILEIDYPNFKDSLADQDRHDVYLRVWQTMSCAQRIDHNREANPGQCGLDFWEDPDDPDLLAGLDEEPDEEEPEPPDHDLARELLSTSRLPVDPEPEG